MLIQSRHSLSVGQSMWDYSSVGRTRLLDVSQVRQRSKVTYGDIFRKVTAKGVEHTGMDML